jgi:NAD(P)-dependent dehydrogenase (short-subunit alcohol dehydrogenase family)
MTLTNIVVTGASSGIGEAISLRLSERGMRVFALARGQDKLDALAARRPGAIVPLAVDVADPGQVAAAFARIESDYGPIDVLINNAGIYERLNFWEQDVQMISQIIDTNLKGTMYCTRLVLPYMLARQAGRIVNIASVSGTRGIPLETSYSASKNGMVGFSDAVAQEVLPHGILVCAICPGAVDTPLWNADNPYHGDPSGILSAGEVAELVEFVLSRPPKSVYKRVILFPSNEWH